MMSIKCGPYAFVPEDPGLYVVPAFVMKDGGKVFPVDSSRYDPPLVSEHPLCALFEHRKGDSMKRFNRRARKSVAGLLGRNLGSAWPVEA